jgi:flagellin-specific chaperone FliS
MNRMKWFSERMGFKKPRTNFQVNEVDQSTRNKLWNVFYTVVWKDLQCPSFLLEKFLVKLWHNYFKHTVDNMPSLYHCYDYIKAHFFSCEWFEVYDFLEFTLKFLLEENVTDIAEVFKEACNDVLKEELSAYRFVGNIIAPRITEEEITTIEEALKNPLINVRKHLENALKLLSDRKNPDYRNSIKESISAVEAICQNIINNKPVPLGKAIDEIKNKRLVKVPHAFLDIINRLYGWTSSSSGIRHALLPDEEIDIGFDEAKFMLVICSAFVNYLTVKAKMMI